MSGVAIIEYGIGNITSMVNACVRVGATPTVTCDGGELLAADPSHIILPGVGAVGEALNNVRNKGIESALYRLVIEGGRPFLGVCVGMQMLAEVCEEFGRHEGLGLVPGRVSRLDEGRPWLRLPHVGWNNLQLMRPDPLLNGLDGHNVYFVHSYAMECPDEFVIATADYGGPFTAAVRRDNVVGVQFHPEKSANLGETLLRGFLASDVKAIA